MDRQKEFVLRTLEERDIRFVRLWFTDVLGFLKSVAIAPAELEGAFEEGIGFDGSSIEGFSRVSESDTVANPDPSTFQVLPWASPTATTTRRGCSATSPCRTVRRRGRTRGTCCAASCRRPTIWASPATCIPRSNSSCSKPGPDDGSPPVPVDNAGYFDQAVHDSALELPPPRDRRPGIHGHLGGVQPPRGRARPAGDRPALRRRAVDGRQRDDVPLRHQGSRDRERRARVVHAQAVRGTSRLGHAHPHEPVRGRRQRLPQPRRPAAALRRGQVLHRRDPRARLGDQRGHQSVGQLLQAAGAAAARRPPRRPGVRPTGRRWCGCPCTRRTRRRRGASRSAAPTRRATRT